MEDVVPSDPHPLIQRSPDVMSGEVVFTGTRVPVRALIDYLQAGDRLEDFLADYPTVTRDQAVAALKMAKEALLQGADTP
jgi:uncharacterized protein (DUF433 family)